MAKDEAITQPAVYRPSYKTEGKPTRQLIQERAMRMKYEEEKATGAPVPDTFEEWVRLE